MTHSDTPAIKTLGSKTFSSEDQRHFATESRDWNPMHIDAVAARRLLSGRQVVHGIHTLIHALNLLSPRGPCGSLRMDCSFAYPVNVGDNVVFTQVDEDKGRTRLSAVVGGLVCTEIVIQILEAEGPICGDFIPGKPESKARHIGELTTPLDEAPESQVGNVFELAGWVDSLAETFPRAAMLLGRDGLAAVAKLSFFVGMVCPGLHSVFSSVRLTTGQASSNPLRFEVRKYDPRFRLFIIAFEGPVHGEIRAFRRPPPQQQASAHEVAERLAGLEFKGTRSLVIGGSRGLGETTAKLVAAGGGNLVVTYAAGHQDAEAVAVDINGNGRGHCEIAQLDLRAAFQGVSGVDPASLDAVYYFATPRIYAKRNDLFDRAAFDEFVDFYLQRFHELCQWLERSPRSKPVKVYLPSTVFITDRPKGMTEYAMAKAAAEVLADDINRNLRNVVVVHSRLPRLATDQTASIQQTLTTSNLETMLAVVRSVAG
jgi:NAD(P)-dependent dehydrogenase (short-subunit alcohol dehydrogenase family)